MPDPLFSYAISGVTSNVTPNDPIWHTSLPMNRYNIPTTNANQSISYGDYFHAITEFLSETGLPAVTSEIGSSCNDPMNVDRVVICQEKHGEFYHPARVEVCVGESSYAFVVNGAISTVGKKQIESEYRILDQLARTRTHCHVPRVHVLGSGRTENGMEIPMFMGQWFNGFHEFHIRLDPDGNQRICLWDGNQTFLSESQTETLYQKAAEILTYYYIPETSDQIRLWHHAAGDFVVCVRPDNLTVKLITVRKYGPAGQSPGADPGSVLQALLMFFLTMSLRMRIDRLDGTGPLIWAEDVAMRGTVEGFFQGLAQKGNLPGTDAPLIHVFWEYIQQIPDRYWDQFMDIAASQFQPNSSEFHMIQNRLERHFREMMTTIRKSA